MKNLLDLYRDDVDGRVISVSGGKEFRGPCPVCGGNDRFGVWPEQNDGRGSFYCGRGTGGGNGCGIGGDAIQYLREVRKYTYAEACDCLGIEARRGGKHLRYTTPQPPRTVRAGEWQASVLGYPEEVEDADKWCEHGEKFIADCHEALLQRPTSIAYLMARGISRQSIVKYQLGFHKGEERDGQNYQPSFRPWPSWGLRQESREGGRHRMLILPAGLVIPYFASGRLHRITIRLIKPDPKQPKKKYHYVRGSIRDVWMTNPSARAFVVQEAELDCIAVNDAAGDLVGTIGLGSTHVKPDVPADMALSESLTILGALDFDQPRQNPRTGQVERPGAAGGRWWAEQYPQYRRWPVPSGKDAGEAVAAGVDLRLWILAGLPPALVERPKSTAEDARKSVVDPQPAAAEVPRATLPIATSQQATSPVDDVREFRALLEESEGLFRIYDEGMSVGPVIPPDWSVVKREKRRRISELLHCSEAVGRLIEELADGIYGAKHIPV